MNNIKYNNIKNNNVKNKYKGGNEELE